MAWLKHFISVLKQLNEAKREALNLAKLDKEARSKPIGSAEDFDLNRLEKMLNARKANERLEIYFQNGTRAVISTANTEITPRQAIW